MRQKGEGGGQQSIKVLCRGHLQGLAQTPFGLADVVGEVGLHKELLSPGSWIMIFRLYPVRKSFGLSESLDPNPVYPKT